MTPPPRLRLPPPPGVVARGVMLLGLVLVFVFVSARRDHDFDGYAEVGRLVRSGADIYAEARPGINTWPPLFSLVTVPLSLGDDVSPYGARVVWLLLGALAFLVVLRQVVDLVHGRRLVLRPAATTDLALGDGLVLAPALLLHAPIVSNFENMQVNMMILALVLAGLTWDARGRPRLGGAALGLAIALRVMPAVFLPYLVWKRRWHAAGIAVVVAALCTALPVVIYGLPQWLAYLEAWLVSIRTSPTWTAGQPNQSLLAMWDRYLGHGVVPFVTAPATRLDFTGLPRVAVAVWATRGLVGLLALLTFRGRGAGTGRTTLVEWSIVLLVGATFGPITWKHYLVVALLPFVLLVALGRDRAADRRTRTIAWTTLGATCLAWTVVVRGIAGRWPAHRMEMASAFTIGTLLLIAGLFVLRVHLQRAPEPAATRTGDLANAGAATV